MPVARSDVVSPFGKLYVDRTTLTVGTSTVMNMGSVSMSLSVRVRLLISVTGTRKLAELVYSNVTFVTTYGVLNFTCRT